MNIIVVPWRFAMMLAKFVCTVPDRFEVETAQKVEPQQAVQ